jgi:hypothetical protein
MVVAEYLENVWHRSSWPNRMTGLLVADRFPVHGM